VLFRSPLCGPSEHPDQHFVIHTAGGSVGAAPCRDPKWHHSGI